MQRAGLGHSWLYFLNHIQLQLKNAKLVCLDNFPLWPTSHFIFKSYAVQLKLIYLSLPWQTIKSRSIVVLKLYNRIFLVFYSLLHSCQWWIPQLIFVLFKTRSIVAHKNDKSSYAKLHSRLRFSLLGLIFWPQRPVYSSWLQKIRI